MGEAQGSALTDPARLRAVADSLLVDSPPEESFDRLTRLAAELLETPAAQVTIVDGQRSFWKSFTGPAAAQIPLRESTIQESFCRIAIAAGSTVVIGDTTTDPRTIGHPLNEKLGVRAWAGSPVRDPDGRILGTFCVIDQRTRAWTARDLGVLDTLAQAASGEIALRRALRVAQERAAALETANTHTAALARTLQRSLLPPGLPAVPGLDVAARYHPAGTGGEVLGDFYDLFQTGPDTWAVALGDVVGKGVQAATVTALARYTIRAGAMHLPGPSDVLSLLNDALLVEQDSDDERFLTAAFAYLRLEQGQARMSLCSAGHTPVLLVHPDGTIETVGEPGMILGAFPDIALADTTVVLLPGDLLLLYTDGVPEARRGGEAGARGEFFGDQRLHEILRTNPGMSATQITALIEHDVLEFGVGNASDDVAILAVRVLPPPSAAQ